MSSSIFMIVWQKLIIWLLACFTRGNHSCCTISHPYLFCEALYRTFIVLGVVSGNALVKHDWQNFKKGLSQYYSPKIRFWKKTSQEIPENQKSETWSITHHQWEVLCTHTDKKVRFLFDNFLRVQTHLTFLGVREIYQEWKHHSFLWWRFGTYGRGTFKHFNQFGSLLKPLLF